MENIFHQQGPDSHPEGMRRYFSFNDTVSTAVYSVQGFGFW
jgi:hypothetical protein